MENWKICGHSVGLGEKHQVMLGPNTPGCEMPATIINGAKPGKTVLITAAIHGDEYPGIAAAIKIAKEIDPALVSGRIIIFSCVNTSGFWERRSSVAEDNENLNGNYPGRCDGTAGERIADFFVRSIFPYIDFIIDLHSGSCMEPLTPCLFFPAGAGERVRKLSEAAAHATDIPYLLASYASTGEYSYAATVLGIPGLLLERGHSGLCLSEWINAFQRDIRLLLQHLAVYPFDDTDGVCSKRVYNDTIYLSAEQTGLWYSNLSENKSICKNDVLGYMEDFYGNRIGEYRALDNGRIFYYTASLAVKKGQALVAYGLEDQRESQ